MKPHRSNVIGLLSTATIGLMLAACVVENPAYDQASDQDASDAGASEVSGPAAEVSDTGSQDSMTSGDTGAGTTSQDASEGGPASSGPQQSATSGGTGSTSAITSSTTGGTGTMGPVEPGDLGQACAQSDGCDALGGGVECCEAAQCMGTCMVPCSDDEECPFAGMACHHDYCLFPCDETDDDCADWPGFTCQHGGRTFCEND